MSPETSRKRDPSQAELGPLPLMLPRVAQFPETITKKIIITAYLSMKNSLTIISLLILLSTGVVGAQEMRHNAQYPEDPAFGPVADSLKGVVMSGEFKDSAIYPETRREWKVYVPVQYDGKTPACVLVGLDGILFNATTVLDNLIASGEMPVTIGVGFLLGVVLAFQCAAALEMFGVEVYVADMLAIALFRELGPKYKARNAEKSCQSLSHIGAQVTAKA